MATRQVLRMRMTGGDVPVMQLALNKNGANPRLLTDGHFGPKTLQALKAFQASRKLVQDGVCGPLSWAALEAKPAPAPTSRLEQTMNPVIRDAIATFRSLGWSEIASVALVANLMWESGGNRFNTIKFDAHGDKDKDGIYRSHGAGQWNERAGRFKLLSDYATRRGKEWTDPETQLLFLDHELNTRPYVKFGAPLRDAKTLEEAMDWTIKIWGPSIPHTDKRLAIAKKLMGQMGG